jgi:hypothetical protein
MVCCVAAADPFEQTGAGAASAIRGTTWKGAQRPAVAYSNGNAGTTVSRNYISGKILVERAGVYVLICADTADPPKFVLLQHCRDMIGSALLA